MGSIDMKLEVVGDFSFDEGFPIVQPTPSGSGCPPP
jgi:hypothetical protein